jgi:hypothetical protein
MQDTNTLEPIGPVLVKSSFVKNLSTGLSAVLNLEEDLMPGLRAYISMMSGRAGLPMSRMAS